jgi:cell division protein FtsN
MLKKTFFTPSNIPSKSLAIFGLALMTSCIGYKPVNQATEIRIVDLNGNPKPIRRIIPEGNAQMLVNQQAQAANVDNAPNNINKSAQQNYQTPNTNQITNNDIAPAENITNNTGTKPVEATVSYDMYNDNTSEVASKTIPETIPEPAQTNPHSGKKFKLAISKTKNTKTISASESGALVQIGSFSSYANAQKALEQSNKISSGKIEEVDLDGEKSYRVFLGPISNSKKVHNILKKAKNSGYKDAFIVR